VGAYEDPVVQVKDKAYILFIDKVMGHLYLYEHRVRRDNILGRVASYKEIVARNEPPHCECGTVPDGASGNIKLDTKASYNPYKYCCKPGVRKFIYSDGPRYLTKVIRKPDVREVNRFGQTVY